MKDDSCERFLKYWFPRAPLEKHLNPPEIFLAYESNLKRFQEDPAVADSEKLFDMAKHLFDHEEDRRANIERKASLYLGFTGVSSSVVAGLGYIAKKQDWFEIGPGFILTYGIFAIALVYLSAATLNSLRVFGPEPRYCLGPDDIPPSRRESTSKYLRRLAGKLLEYVISNYKINNRQFAHLDVAQDCFRNAVILFFCAGFIPVIARAISAFADGQAPFVAVFHSLLGH